ncbi:hypothetical protein UK15_07750 [Streptomyces variegatus]|uniref:Lipoprotein n=1 Tax=Streptomyces variegatus TaxID=284040 RepID=A0A0M2GY43_9ACTN|nr:hypothetical protein UK15_07750 [Streptomyces variegatus]
MAALTLTACSGTDTDAKPKGSASKPGLTQQEKDELLKDAGIPPEPTGADRAELLSALAEINPDIVKHEDKAIGAAQNQCGAINRDGSRLDHWAAERFTYRDVTTTEAQGKRINQTLRRLGFCKV